MAQLPDELSALQTQAAKIQAAVAALADADASAAGPVQELERSLLSAEKDLRAVQAEWRTLRAKGSLLLEICRSLKGQVAELGAELSATQAELGNLTSK